MNKMDFSFNELSLEGVSAEDKAFKQGIDQVMNIRQLLRRLNRDLYCSHSIQSTLMVDGKNIYQAISLWDIEPRRALLGWLTKFGPFWEDIRKHSEDDFFAYKDLIVTGSAVGEVAFLCSHGLDWRLVSLAPSSWEFSPVPVDWYKSDEESTSMDVINYWTFDQIKGALDEDSQTISSWEDLKQFAYGRYSNISFLTECFEGLQGFPFMFSQSKRILVLLQVLDELENCVDRFGKRTDEGHRIHRNYFEGDTALFSPSSVRERSRYKKELTFPHPDRKDETLFCHWHGKVSSSPPIRIHFSWPNKADEPLYVVYVGPKLTRD